MFMLLLINISGKSQNVFTKRISKILTMQYFICVPTVSARSNYSISKMVMFTHDNQLRYGKDHGFGL